MVVVYGGKSTPQDHWTFVKKFTVKLFITLKTNVKFFFINSLYLSTREKVKNDPYAGNALQNC